MMLVNMRRRWTYKGSVTTPPCATTVYWNVVKTIYPIKAEHLQKFKDVQMKRGQGTYFAPDNLTNYRLIQPLGDRVVTHIEDGGRGGGPIMIILIVIIVILLIATIVCWKKAKQSRDGAKNMGQVGTEMK